MARVHRVRLSIPDLTQDQADQLAASLDGATVTHETNLPVAPDATRVVMAVRAQKPVTAGNRAAVQVADALAAIDAPPFINPLWEVVPA